MISIDCMYIQYTITSFDTWTVSLKIVIIYTILNQVEKEIGILYTSVSLFSTSYFVHSLYKM